MTTFRGRWSARVEQDFEVDAESEAEARELIEGEMSPARVVELLDMEVDWIEEA